MTFCLFAFLNQKAVSILKGELIIVATIVQQKQNAVPLAEAGSWQTSLFKQNERMSCELGL